MVAANATNTTDAGNTTNTNATETVNATKAVEAEQAREMQVGLDTLLFALCLPRFVYISALVLVYYNERRPG